MREHKMATRVRTTKSKHVEKRRLGANARPVHDRTARVITKITVSKGTRALLGENNTIALLRKP